MKRFYLLVPTPVSNRCKTMVHYMSRTVLSIVWYVVWYVNRGLKVDDTRILGAKRKRWFVGTGNRAYFFLLRCSFIPTIGRHGNPMARRGAARSCAVLLCAAAALALLICAAGEPRWDFRPVCGALPSECMWHLAAALPRLQMQSWRRRCGNS